MWIYIISKWPDKGSQKDKHCIPSVIRGSLTLTVRYAYGGVRKCGWKLEKGCLWLEKEVLSEGCGEDNGTKQKRGALVEKGEQGSEAGKGMGS